MNHAVDIARGSSHLSFKMNMCAAGWICIQNVKSIICFWKLSRVFKYLLISFFLHFTGEIFDDWSRTQQNIVTFVYRVSYQVKIQLYDLWISGFDFAANSIVEDADDISGYSISSSELSCI